MKTFWKVLSYLLVAILASALTLSAVVGIPGFAGVSGDASKLEQLKDMLVERYIGGADETELEEAAAHAMVSATGDRWSYYIPADQYQAYIETMETAYVGIGITIQAAEDNSGFLVTKVNAGGPAEEAGVLAGDVIVAIEGQSASGMTSDEAKNLVRGEENTAVNMTFRRNGETLELSILRKTVQVEVATGKLLEGNVGLVTIANFDLRCSEETIAAIEKLLEEGATALIFDVRNNPGGYAKQLVDVLDYLLPEGELFRTVDYTGAEDVDMSDAACLDIPMAVLVNLDSYSAAEFFAAALREYEAAVVVGEPTVGKGYFQTTIRLNDGSAVSLSVGKYYTPKGVSLADAGGFIPDLIVEVDEETAFKIYADSLAPEEDPQIQAAVDALNQP